MPHPVPRGAPVPAARPSYQNGRANTSPPASKQGYLAPCKPPAYNADPDAAASDPATWPEWTDCVPYALVDPARARSLPTEDEDEDPDAVASDPAAWPEWTDCVPYAIAEGGGL